MTAELEHKEVLAVLNYGGLNAALDMIDKRAPRGRLARHVAAAFAERVLPIFEDVRPDDPRPRRAIEIARDDNATPEERAKAADDALDAKSAAALAAGDAAGAAVGAARGAVWDAAQAARAAVWAAVWAARGAVWDVVLDVERAAQKRILREMLTETPQ